jgi:hypothetical protein
MCHVTEWETLHCTCLQVQCTTAQGQNRHSWIARSYDSSTPGLGMSTFKPPNGLQERAYVRTSFVTYCDVSLHVDRSCVNITIVHV